MPYPVIGCDRDSDKTIAAATAIRDRFLECITSFITGPHEPELEQHEKDRVIDKIVSLLERETRATYWVVLGRQKTPTINDGVVKLTPTILEWAGRKKAKRWVNADPTPRIGHAKNGRVIRDAKGL